MLTLNNQEIQVGTRVKFKTLNSYDNNLWYGVVLAAETAYSVARALGSDLVNYHSQIKTSFPDIPDAETSTYLIIDTVDGGERFVCATDWIELSTVQVVDAINNELIEVLGIPSSEVDNLLQLLTENGYKVRKKA